MDGYAVGLSSVPEMCVLYDYKRRIGYFIGRQNETRFPSFYPSASQGLPCYVAQHISPQWPE